MTDADEKEAEMERLFAERDRVLAAEVAAGYQCIPVKPPAALRARRGCRGCGEGHEHGGTPLGICFLMRRFVDKKVLLFSFLALCQECAEDDEIRERVTSAIFDQGTLETVQ
jgi:hypothetical protein